MRIEDFSYANREAKYIVFLETFDRDVNRNKKDRENRKEKSVEFAKVYFPRVLFFSQRWHVDTGTGDRSRETETIYEAYNVYTYTYECIIYIYISICVRIAF